MIGDRFYISWTYMEQCKSNNFCVAAPGSNIVFAGIADEAAGTNEDHVKVDINKLPPTP